jgi:HD-like signal output (HDOD) protein
MSDLIDFNEVRASNVLPSPKGIGLKVMQLCQQEQVSLKELARLIQGDPVLSGRIIKLANAVNRNKQRQIASITSDVLILVGVHAVRQVVMGISMVTSYKNGECGNFDYGRFWSHSVAMGCAAQLITAAVNVAPVAEMFITGLLANIGRLGLASARPQAYSALIGDYRQSEPTEFIEAEQAQFGFTHLTLAVAMMSDWNIPRLFADGVLYHRAPSSSPLPADSRNQKIVLVLQLAGRLADHCMASDETRAQSVESLSALARALDIGDESLAQIAARLSEEWLEWGTVLQVPVRALAPFSPALQDDGCALAHPPG